MAGRILVADDDVARRILLKSHLSATFDVQVADRADHILAQCYQDPPDLLVLNGDYRVTRTQEVFDGLRASDRFASLPVMVVTDAESRQNRITALQAGADAIMSTEAEAVLLRARLRNLLHRAAMDADLRAAQSSDASLGFEESMDHAFDKPGKIALIAPSLAQGLAWRNGLRQRMRDMIDVIDPAQPSAGLSLRSKPDAVVVAGDAQSQEGLAQLLSDLRCAGDTLQTITLLVQEQPEMAQAVEALNLGVNDVVDRGFDAEEVALILRRELARKARNDSRRAALRNSIKLAVTDPLTGLYNRRYALQRLAQVDKISREQNDCYAVMVLDLDRFKSINDAYGHKAGDAVLAEVSRRMQTCLRQGDFLARIGGEEFLAVVHGCQLDQARVAAERLRRAVADQTIQLSDDAGQIQVTVSIGLVIAGLPNQHHDPAELIDLADRGLYAAKAEGRNQVTVYQSAA